MGRERGVGRVRRILRCCGRAGLTFGAVLLMAALAAPSDPASAETLYWFAPLPPMPFRPGLQYVGTDDFMDLFKPDAPWQSAARHIQVFKLYGEWVGGSATDDQLKQ